MDTFPRFIGLYALSAITLVLAIVGVTIQLRHGQRTGAVLLGAWVIVVGGGLVAISLLRRRLRP